MIGEPMPNPQYAIIQDLNQKMEQFLGSGKTIQQIERGVSADAPFLGTTSHHNKLRAQRDKLSPQVRELAEAGKTASEVSAALKIHIKRVQLIGRENGLSLSSLHEKGQQSGASTPKANMAGYSGKWVRGKKTNRETQSSWVYISSTRRPTVLRKV